MTTLLIIIAILLALWLAVLLVRAALYRAPREVETGGTGRAADQPGGKADSAEAARHLSGLVRCRTVTPGHNGDGNGYAEFEKLRRRLEEFYPLTHERLEREIVNGQSLLYRWPAEKAGEKAEPWVFMAHYDVVPAREEQWTHPPFSGAVENGVIWGRGTLDTKCTLCSVFEAVESLLKEGFAPGRDIYLAFGHDEETGGEGALGIVKLLEARGVRPGLVLDEGGAIMEGLLPGIDRPIAFVGASEKGLANIEVSIDGNGGHSSAPGRHDPLGLLAGIIGHIEKNPFPVRLPREVVEMFSILGRHMSFSRRIIFANLWCFKPLLAALLPALGREMNALCRTTCVFTVARGGEAANVIPDRVRAVANLRPAASDRLDKVLQHLRDQAGAVSGPAARFGEPFDVKVELLQGHDASPTSDLDSAAYALLRKTIEDCFPGTVVVPYIMLGASDSRHYCAISSGVFRFLPFRMTGEELRTIHGVDERVSVDKLAGCIEFYRVLVGRA